MIKALKAALTRKPRAKKEPVIEESPEKQEYRRMMEAYKIANPVKYEQKRVAFEARLETL